MSKTYHRKPEVLAPVGGSEQLKAAVFSAGYRDGLRAGMVLRTTDGKNRFQIIMLRDFTSAGMLLSGNIRSVSIGTELRASGEPTAK